MTDPATPLANRVTFGAFAANEPWPDLSSHYALEATLGARLPVMSWFTALDSGWLPKQAAAAAASGHDLLICLQPSLSNRTPVLFSEILAGAWDARLDSFFTKAAAYPRQVTIRFCHEMNLYQQPHSIAHQGGCTSSIDEWLDTWRYVVDRQRRIGGTVQWQWCVNSIDMGGVAAESYWPGADYVDSVSIDSYNGYGPWTPAVKQIKPMYARVTALHPTADVWLAEIGCREVRAGEKWDKAAWFAELLATTEFPRMSTICFFNANKERDWRVTGTGVLPGISALIQGARLTQR